MSKEEYWREHIERQELSGKSISQYCRSEGVSSGSFEYWRKKIRKVQRGFVRIEPSGLVVQAVRSSISIELRSGVVIRVPDVTTLAEVVKVLDASK